MSPMRKRYKSGRQSRRDIKEGKKRGISSVQATMFAYLSAHVLDAYARCTWACLFSSPLPFLHFVPARWKEREKELREENWLASSHNGRRDYVGALGIPYSGSASLNRISERISAWSVCDRVYSHFFTHTDRRKSVRRKEKKEKNITAK